MMRAVVRSLRGRLPFIVWLTLVWVLLWGTFTPLSIVGGVVLAVIVTGLFRMPAADRLPVRPLWLLGLIAYLAYDLVVSGLEVSWEVLRHGRRTRGAIVAVPLVSRSDRVVAVTANAVTLSPGTMALQIDSEEGVYYFYTLGTRDLAGVERARLRILDMQRRVLAALGSPDELAEVERRMAKVKQRVKQ